MRVVPVSRIVVFPLRSWVVPLMVYLVDGTCQNPCELRSMHNPSEWIFGGDCDEPYLSTAVYIIGCEVTVGST